ncbi:hypothetical protein [Bradyrhizobium sp.]|uniref:hypothetical protein n=1 Tax=Bradyrhizobium sp. TaxID=376 RepID=UPI003C791B66
MKDWNIIVTIYQEGFRRALRALQDIGSAARSPYHNVLVMKVDDPMAVLKAVERLTEERPALYDAIARVAPAMINRSRATSHILKSAVMCETIVLSRHARFIESP